VAAIETAPIAERGVAILEKLIALLRQPPLRARRAMPAAVRERPRDALAHWHVVPRTRDHVTDGLVPEHTRRRSRAAAIERMEIGPADRSQRNLRQHLAGMQRTG